MRGVFRLAIPVLFVASCVLAQENNKSAGNNPSGGGSQGYTLTIDVDGVNQQGGNIGVLLFQNDKGWPEDRMAAFKDIRQPAHSGTVVIRIPNLQPGTYAVAVGHDVNLNRKVDKNWFGKPTEQWGMSNNPRATIKAPSFDKAKFTLNHDSEIHIRLQ